MHNIAARYLFFVSKSYAYIFFRPPISCQIPEILDHVTHKQGFWKTSAKHKQEFFSELTSKLYSCENYVPVWLVDS